MPRNFPLTVLHVEENQATANLVRLMFEDFGFTGTVISAATVREASELLKERAGSGQDISLVLVDMELADGLGIDVIREVRADPVWKNVPIVVLSGEVDERMVNRAYALGANCYIPKVPDMTDPIHGLQMLYTCWLQVALLPVTCSGDLLQEALTRSASLRARTSQFYLEVARRVEPDPEEVGFWMERSLVEGNLSNLLTFLSNVVCVHDLPRGTIERFKAMQVRTATALAVAEAALREERSPDHEEVCRQVFGLLGSIDEEVVAEVIGSLFPKAQVATIALKERAATQIRALAMHVLNRTQAADLREQAATFLELVERLVPQATG